MKVTTSPKYITVNTEKVEIKIFCPAHTKKEKRERKLNLPDIVMDALQDALDQSVDSTKLWNACCNSK